MSNEYGAPASAGLSENIAGGLCYITFIPAIIFLVLEPYNKNSLIRFNAFQSIFLSVASIAINIFHFVPFIGWIISLVLSLAVFVFWIIAIINAFQGKKYLVPLIGNYAEQAAGS